MRAFVSHVSADLIWAQATRRALEALDIECFLAHENISVSEDWRDRIIKELSSANLFVAILSERFKESDWCGHEVGFAVARGDDDLDVIALATDTQLAYGFIQTVHHGTVRSEEDVARVIEEGLYVRKPRMMIPHQIERLRTCKSPAAAARGLRPLSHHFDRFMDSEVDALLAAIEGNRNLMESEVCRTDYIMEFLGTFKDRMQDSRYQALIRLAKASNQSAVWL